MFEDGDLDSRPQLSGADNLPLDAVPLFPLPGLVHFPHAVLPLHVFEPRYRAMTSDALAGNRLIAMALLRDERDCASPGASRLHPVVCVGRIIRHERMADGRFNLLLEGLSRAQIIVENKLGSPDRPSSRHKLYRTARLRQLRELGRMEIDLERQRDRMRSLLEHSAMAAMPDTFRQLLAGPTSTAKIADLMAFHLVEDIRFKQSLLSDGRVPRRVDRLIAHLQPPPYSAELLASSSLN